MSPRQPLAPLRRAFTLIELLAVITIIAILTAMTFALFGPVQTSRREARARTEIRLLEVKLEEFKNRYGEYPMAEADSETEWERVLFNALTGRWAYKKVDGKLTWNKTQEGASPETLRPFLESGAVGTDAQDGKTATKFVDPWGNAYRYRFGKLNTSTGKPDTTWNRSGVLLISKGNKFRKADTEGDDSSDCFSGSMGSTGVVESDYFDDEYRVDNLTNFGAK